MEFKIKVVARKTISGNTHDRNNILSEIIADEISFNRELTEIKNSVLKRLLATDFFPGEIIKPLKYHGVSVLELFTEKVPQMLAQLHPIGSSNYTFTYEVSSLPYECINTFPSREFLLIEKENDNLISFKANTDDEILIMKNEDYYTDAEYEAIYGKDR